MVGSVTPFPSALTHTPLWQHEKVPTHVNCKNLRSKPLLRTYCTPAQHSSGLLKDVNRSITHTQNTAGFNNFLALCCICIDKTDVNT